MLGLSLLVCVFLAILVSYIIPQIALFEIRNSISMRPSDLGIRSEEVVLQPSDAKINIYGWWMPADNAIATLIFIHGATSNRHSEFFKSIHFYKALIQNNISVLSIDLRNHGDSDADGNGLGFGISEAYDVTAAISWAKSKILDQPLFAMGISMGSASIIHAESHIKDLSGVILLDPMLHTQSAFARGAGAQTRAPWPLFTPSAYIATWLYGLPHKSSDAFSKLCSLNIPILLIQDPDDPVAIARFSRNAAATNSKIIYWEAPKVSPKHPALREHGGWGSHVTAYAASPNETFDEINSFVRSLMNSVVDENEQKVV